MRKGDRVRAQRDLVRPRRGRVPRRRRVRDRPHSEPSPVVRHGHPPLRGLPPGAHRVHRGDHADPRSACPTSRSTSTRSSSTRTGRSSAVGAGCRRCSRPARGSGAPAERRGVDGPRRNGSRGRVPRPRRALDLHDGRARVGGGAGRTAARAARLPDLARSTRAACSTVCAAHRRVVLRRLPRLRALRQARPALHARAGRPTSSGVRRRARARALALLTHDMGDTVGGELLRAQLEGTWPVRGQPRVLTNGSIYIDMAQLTPGQQLLLASRRAPATESALDARRSGPALAGTFSPALVGDDEELAAQWQLVARDDGHRLLPRPSATSRSAGATRTRYTGAIETHPSPLARRVGRRRPDRGASAMTDRLRTARPDAVVDTPRRRRALPDDRGAGAVRDGGQARADAFGVATVGASSDATSWACAAAYAWSRTSRPLTGVVGDLCRGVLGVLRHVARRALRRAEHVTRRGRAARRPSGANWSNSVLAPTAARASTPRRKRNRMTVSLGRVGCARTSYPQRRVQASVCLRLDAEIVVETAHVERARTATEARAR